MSPRTLPASPLILSPLKASAFLLGGIALAIVITGCSPAEPEKSEAEKQASSAAVGSSEDQKAAVSSTKPESTTTETVPVAKMAMSPKETFIKMSLEIQKVATYGDYEAFALKYMTKKGSALFQAQSNDLSETEKNQEVSKIKEYLLSSEKITTNIQENINGSTATLTAPSRDGGDFELITLDLENNQWKVSPDDFRRLVEFTL